MAGMDCATHEAAKPATPVALINRKRLSPEQRQEILARYHGGQLTMKQFVAQEGLSTTTLCTWLKQERLRSQAGPESSVPVEPAIHFQELKLPLGNSTWAMEIVTPQNWTLRLAQPPEPNMLQHWLRALPC